MRGWENAEWMTEHWYLLVLGALLVFAYGAYRNWRREKRRERLTDRELRGVLGEKRPGDDDPDPFRDIN